MNEQETNKALHGVIRPGECWHEFDNFTTLCRNCNKLTWHIDDNEPNPDYFSKEGFWDAFEYAQQKFMFEDCFGPYKSFINIHLQKLNHKTFAKYLHDFLLAEGIIKCECKKGIKEEE